MYEWVNRMQLDWNTYLVVEVIHEARDKDVHVSSGLDQIKYFPKVASLLEYHLNCDILLVPKYVNGLFLDNRSEKLTWLLRLYMKRETKMCMFLLILWASSILLSKILHN